MGGRAGQNGSALLLNEYDGHDRDRNPLTKKRTMKANGNNNS